MKRAILYARVSTLDKQHPELQLEQLRAVATQREWTVVMEVKDRISGAAGERPGLDDALNFIRAGKANVLAATALDRVGRSLPHLIDVEAELRKLHCTLILLRENVDTTTVMGRYLFQVMGAGAELQRALIREGVVLGLEHARSRGVKLGQPRKLDYSQLARAQQLRVEGNSWGDIARLLGGTPGAWSRALSRAA